MNPANLHARFYIALVIGARSGKLICLTWDDVDGAELSFNKTATGIGDSRSVGPPKSRAGVRTNTLPADAVAVLERQYEYLTGLNLESTGLVFPNEKGQMLDNSNIGRSLRTWTKLAGITTILTPHELRHTFVSMATARGMSPVDIARQIGHADAGFTLCRYAHFFERAQRPAPPSLDDLLGPPEKAGSGIRSGISTGNLN